MLVAIATIGGETTTKFNIDISFSRNFSSLGKQGIHVRPIYAYRCYY